MGAKTAQHEAKMVPEAAKTSPRSPLVGDPWGRQGSIWEVLGCLLGLALGTIWASFCERIDGEFRNEFVVVTSCVLMMLQGSKLAFRSRGASISEKSSNA
jgi:hypothetical protein